MLTARAWSGRRRNRRAWTHLIALRSRKVVRVELYPNRAEAFEAAGLSE